MKKEHKSSDIFRVSAEGFDIRKRTKKCLYFSLHFIVKLITFFKISINRAVFNILFRFFFPYRSETKEKVYCPFSS